MSCSLASSAFADASNSATVNPPQQSNRPSENYPQQSTQLPKDNHSQALPPSTSESNQEAPVVNVTPKSGGGQMLTSEEGHFSISIPTGFSDVGVESQSVDTEVGPINTINYSASSENSTYIVGSSEYPKDILNAIKGKEQEVFDGAQEGLLMHMRGKITSKNDITIDGHKARTVDFSASVDNETLYGKLQLILAEPRLFHLLYITNKKDELNNHDAQEFFNSIKISD